MKMLARIFYGAACACLSVFSPYWIFAIMHNVDTVKSPPHYGSTVIATAISLAIFCIYRIHKRTKSRAGCLGAISSYLAFLLAAFAWIYLFGNNLEYWIWLPVNIPVGALYLAPVVIFSGIGSHLTLSKE